MERSDKNSWLGPGAGDLREQDVEDVPSEGKSVRVRALPAAYSNQASSEALVYETFRGEQRARIDTGKLEVLQFANGVVDPVFTVPEAEQIAKTFGPAFKRVIEVIDELSGINKEELEEAQTKFPAERPDAPRADVANGASAGSSRPPVPSRAGT